MAYADTVTQTTTLNDTGNSLSAEMKTFYRTRLVDAAEPALVHDQFGDRYPIPRGNGKTIEFRRFSSLPKALSPITEGVSPEGLKLNVTSVTETVQQYGAWTRISDLLDMTAVDNVIVQATHVLGSQAGRTLDTLTRDVLTGGTQKIYAPTLSGSVETPVYYRHKLDDTARLTPKLIFRAAADLSAMNAPTLDGGYVAIIHPFVKYDLMTHPDWVDINRYGAPERIYNGEVGKIGNVRFIESSEAKIWRGADLTAASRTLTVRTAISSATTTVAVNEAISAAEAAALANRPILIGGNQYTIASATAGAANAASLTLSTSISAAAASDVVYPGEGGAQGLSVFATLVMGAHAFAVTELEGGGLEHIVKQRGYGDDPLNQRSAVGWKATKCVKRLVEEYLTRIESTGEYSSTAAAN